MATTVLSLVEEIRDQLGDYGEASTALTSDHTAAVTTIACTASTGFEVGGFAYCEYEALEVTATGTGTLTVRRGARGTTAAAHASGAIVRGNLTWGNSLILSKLNEALDAAYPDVYTLVGDPDSTAVEADQYIYELSTTIDKLYRVEIESENHPDVYIECNAWDQPDKTHIRIYDIGQYTVGKKINLVGIAPFSAVSIGGNVDTDFPIAEGSGKGYLVCSALGRLLMVPQARIARRDSFVGMTDGFQNAQPYMSMAVAREYLNQAKAYLAKIRMPVPQFTLPNPGRSFMYAGQ